MPKKSSKKPAARAAASFVSALPEVSRAPLKGATLPVHRVHASALNPRQRMEAAPLAALAADIAANGLLQPILVRPHPARDGDFEIICGARRHAAISLLVKDHLWPTERGIVAHIREASDAELVMIAGAENLQREDLTPVEEAELFAALRPLIKEGAKGRAEEHIAARLHVGVNTVFRRLRLLKAIEPVRHAVTEGKITLETAEAYALGSDADQKRLWKRAQDASWLNEPRHVRDEMLQSRIAVTRAVFDPSTYDGEIIADIDGTEYFADSAQAAKLHDEAVRLKLDELKPGRAFVEFIRQGDSWRFAKIGADDPAAGAVFWIEDHAKASRFKVKQPVLHPDEAARRSKAQLRSAGSEAKPSGATPASPDANEETARDATNKRLFTSAQVVAFKSAKTRALRRGLEANAKAAIAVVILGLLAADDVDLRVGTRDRRHQPELNTDPLLIDTERRRPLVEKLIEGSGIEAEDGDEDGNYLRAVLSCADEREVSGLFRHLVALDNRTLEAILAMLVADTIGARAEEGRRFGDNEFEIALAEEVGAQGFVGDYWGPPPEYFKAMTKSQRQALIARAGGLPGVDGLSGKAEDVAKVLANEPRLKNAALFPECAFATEEQIRVALAPDNRAHATAEGETEIDRDEINVEEAAA